MYMTRVQDFVPYLFQLPFRITKTKCSWGHVFFSFSSSLPISLFSGVFDISFLVQETSCSWFGTHFFHWIWLSEEQHMHITCFSSPPPVRKGQVRLTVAMGTTKFMYLQIQRQHLISRYWMQWFSNQICFQIMALLNLRGPQSTSPK